MALYLPFAWTAFGNLDFQNAANIVKGFVKNRTNDLIEKILDEESVSASTRLIMVNVIYFKGSWKYQFQKENTKTLTFHVDKQREVGYVANVASLEM